MKALMHRAARQIPPVRRLIEARDAAFVERNAAIKARDTDSQEVLRKIMRIASRETFLHAKLNGTALWLPRDTVRTMHHCAIWESDDTLSLWVETAHLTWMMDHLADGGTFLDVGAATGATVLPVAGRFGQRITIVAYEPSVAARDLLLATLARNEINSMTVRPVGVSDVAGSFEFCEFAQDETGAVPWRSEMSSLAAPGASAAPHRTYTVPVVVLDDDVFASCSPPVVIKIDVEGFEACVLRGAQQLIKTHQPHLSIDIHTDPFGDGVMTTESAVTALLPDYTFERLGHVLLCSPAEARS